MPHENRSDAASPKVFSEAEYKADARKVIAHALAAGTAIVARPDGSPRVVISIPPADKGVADR